jgi:hypothetical protein
MSGKYPGGIVTAGAPAGYSVAFDGTGDQLTIPSSSAFAVGTTFTFECWIYPLTSGGVNGQPFFVNTTSAEIQVGYQSSTAWGVAANGVVWRLTTTTMPTLNAWNHIVVTRSGLGTNQTSLFLNGVRVANGTVADVWTSAGAANIGLAGSGTYTGYISNLRLVKGTAVYDPTQTTINVPTQLFPITNTSLLTCQSPTLVDNSTNNFTITAVGNAVVSTFTPFTGYTAGASGFQPALGAAAPGVWTLEEATYYQGNRLWPIYDPNFNQTTLMLHGNSPTNLPTWITDASTNNFAVAVNGDAKADSQTPFNKTTYPTSGSGYFDGTADQLTLANNTAFDFGSGNFTLECWVYLTATTGSIINYSNGQTSNSNFAWEIYQASATSVQISILQGATAYTATSAGFSINAWNHVACVRNGNTLTIYVNGTAGGTTANVTGVTISIPGGSTVKISGYNNATGMITGYVSNVRIVKGQALATGNFTSPTAPLTTTAVGWTGANAASSITGTISLLTLQNQQPTGNSSFTDSSTNNFPITRFGNTTQGTFTPFSQTGWSAQFVSGFPYISFPNNAGYNFGTDNFTLEFWFYGVSIGSDARFISNATYNASGIDISWESSQSRITWYIGSTSYNTSTLPSLNAWHHIAFSRSGTTLYVFVDGVLKNTYTGVSANITSANALNIGGYTNGTATFDNNYISNMRLVKGTALYTSAFTPSTSPLTPIPNTTLLTLQDNRFKDNSTIGAVPTVNGTVAVQTFSPFPPLTAYTALNVGGSGYFNSATPDYLTVANNALLAAGTGDFTWEAWVYWIGGAGENTLWVTDVSGGMNIGLNIGGTWQIATRGISAQNNFGAVVKNQWNYLAISRTGTTINAYINGARVFNGANSTNYVSGGTLGIGAIPTASGNAFLGYMSDLRWTKGTALYTGTTMTVPATPSTTTSNGASSTTVELLTNFTNAGIIDSTSDNVLQTVGGAGISTAQSKYGGSSIRFNGTTDYLVSPNSPNWDMGSGSYTIEFWVYLNTLTGSQTFIARANTGSIYATFDIGWYSSVLRLYVSNNGSTNAVALASSISPVAATWTHIAVTRNGSTYTIWVNGVSGGTATDSGSAVANGNNLGIGAYGNGANPLNGYLEDLRITKGVARYTTTFTPPTSQLQSQ